MSKLRDGFVARRKELVAAIERAEEELKDQESALEDLDRELLPLLVPKKRRPKPNPEALVAGTWKCDPSPIGVCVYDEEEDPCRDECLLCGQPDERK